MTNQSPTGSYRSRGVSLAPGIPGRLMQVFDLLGLLVVVSHFGFQHGPVREALLVAAEIMVAIAFCTDLILCLWEAKDPWAVLRQRWYEYILLVGFILLIVGLALVSSQPWLSELLGAFHVPSTVILQMGIIRFFIMGNLVTRFLRIQAKLLEMGLRPEYLLISSFAMLVMIGFGLLLLPRIVAPGGEPMSVVDALFMATSAVCVTGLSVRDTGGDFSTFGQLVILGLIQVGGMGIVTFVALVSVLSSRSLSLPQMVALKDIVNAKSIADVRRYVLGIAFLAVGIEFIGCVLIFLASPAEIGDAWQRWYWSVFHSVSAFCNAGFSLHSDSLTGIQHMGWLNIVFMGLIILGGMGFPVMLDLMSFRIGGLNRYRRWHFLRDRTPVKLSRVTIHSRISLVMMVVLVMGGAVMFWLLEHGLVMSGMSFFDQVLVSFFQSVTTRTAGFNTVPVEQLHDATLVVMLVLMVIGAGPVSTGGGIKTVAMGVILLTMYTMIRGRDHVEVFGRTLPRRIVHASITVFIVYIGVATLVIFGLAITDPEMTLQSQAFEAVSALSTVGLTTGITAELSSPGKLLLIVAMFIGRVGPLTLVMTVVRSGRPQQAYQYPEEDVIVS